MNTIINTTDIIKIISDNSYLYEMTDDLKEEILKNPKKYFKDKTKWVAEGVQLQYTVLITFIFKATKSDIENFNFNTEYLKYLLDTADNNIELITNIKNNLVKDWSREIINDTDK